jgi:hypothetical protein
VSNEGTTNKGVNILDAFSNVALTFSYTKNFTDARKWKLDADNPVSNVQWKRGLSLPTADANNTKLTD